MKTTNTFKVVMLPTGQTEGVLFQETTEKLLIENRRTNIKWKDCEYQHLYIISDEEIKEGDWCINSQMNLFQASKGFCSETLKSTNSKKVIATTDKSLMIDI